MENNNSEIIIQSILVRPRTKSFVTIEFDNSGEEHAKTYKEITKFLKKYNVDGQLLQKYLNNFKTFVVFTETGRLQEISYKKMKYEDFKKMKNKENLEKSLKKDVKPMTFDEKMAGISKMKWWV
jgi:hypothetical protein